MSICIQVSFAVFVAILVSLFVWLLIFSAIRIECYCWLWYQKYCDCLAFTFWHCCSFELMYVLVFIIVALVTVFIVGVVRLFHVHCARDSVVWLSVCAQAREDAEAKAAAQALKQVRAWSVVGPAVLLAMLLVVNAGSGHSCVWQVLVLLLL